LPHEFGWENHDLVKMTYVSALFESFWELGMASIGLRQATNKDGYIKEVDKWKAK